MAQFINSGVTFKFIHAAQEKGEIVVGCADSEFYVNRKMGKLR